MKTINYISCLRHFEKKMRVSEVFDLLNQIKNESIDKLVPWKDSLVKHMQVIFDKILYL